MIKDWPRCDWSEPGKWCENGKVVYAPCGPDAEGNFTPYVTDDDCPKCHGSGERDLTEQEAWDYLNEWNPTDADLTAENVGGEVHVSFAATDGINVKDVCWDNYELIPEPGFWEGATLKIALNAACRAVRERKEGR